jgi:hypothetical protein
MNTLQPGTRVRDLYCYSDTHVIVRKKKHQHAADVRYFGSEEAAAQWYIVKSDTTGGTAVMHRDMLSVRNDD